MKRIILLALSLLMLVPCEAMTAGGNPQAKSKAQKYAEKKSKNTIRAWAQYTGFSSMDLESFAAAAARAKLAESVEIFVDKMVEDYGQQTLDNGFNEKGMAQIGGESGQTTGSNFKTVADALIRNSRVVMSDRYVQKDGTVVCCVAVEVGLNDIETVAKTSQAVKNALESVGVKVDSPEYKEALKETRKDYASGKLDLSTL